MKKSNCVVEKFETFAIFIYFHVLDFF